MNLEREYVHAYRKIFKKIKLEKENTQIQREKVLETK